MLTLDLMYLEPYVTIGKRNILMDTGTQYTRGGAMGGVSAEEVEAD